MLIKLWPTFVTDGASTSPGFRYGDACLTRHVNMCIPVITALAVDYFKISALYSLILLCKIWLLCIITMVVGRGSKIWDAWDLAHWDEGVADSDKDAPFPRVIMPNYLFVLGQTV